MLKVNTFLGCMKLETGGHIIGWLHVIGNFLTFVFAAAMSVFLSMISSEDLRKLFSDYDDLNEDDIATLSIGKDVMIWVGVIVAAFTIGFFIISCFFLRGMDRKNHTYVKPLMILIAVMATLSFLDIFSFNFSTIGGSIIQTVVYSYEFIVVYSIYRKFADEFYKAPPSYYQSPILGPIEKV